MDRDTGRLLSGEAWREWCDRLKATGERILESDFPDDERTRVEGFRALTRLVGYANRIEVEAANPRHPSFVRYEETYSQWGGPNPDNTYLRARIDPTLNYRIWANVKDTHQIIFSQHEGDMHLEQYGVFHECSFDDLEISENGDLEIFVGPDEKKRNWSPIDPKASLYTIRIYLSDWEKDASPTFHIECLDTKDELAPEPTAAELVRGLDRAMSWVEASATYWNDYTWKQCRARPSNIASRATSTPGGADNIAYGSCFWDLAEDEALMLTCEVPDAQYWNLCAHTLTWLESGDFARRQTSLSGGQMHIDADGLFRVVVSKQDPGVPNWIDTEGRPQGMVAYRWVWANTKPTPDTKVVKLADLRSELPADHPSVSADTRARQLREREVTFTARGQ